MIAYVLVVYTHVLIFAIIISREQSITLPFLDTCYLQWYDVIDIGLNERGKDQCISISVYMKSEEALPCMYPIEIPSV